MQSQNFTKKIEVIANISIILVAILICCFAANRFWFDRSSNKESPAPQIIGSELKIHGIKWENRQSLLLVLQKGCKFCTESAEFYKKLVQRANSKNDTKLVAVFSHSSDVGSQYLNDLGVKIDSVEQVSFESLKVEGTPTLILVDSQGLVKKVWVGRLPPKVEEEVLAAM